MNSWLLSIVGVVVVGVLVEVLLTDSPTAKFIRSIYAFLVLFVIVQPLPGFFRNIGEAVSGEIVLDTELWQTINAQTASAMQIKTQDTLESAGFSDCIVTIETDKAAAPFKVSKVYVNAYNISIDGKNAGRDIKTAITQIVSAVCGVDSKQIFVVGR